MERYETGMLAKSKAGHDKGHIYVITGADETYVYLTDGRIRTLNRPKKKKKKHIQIILRQYDLTAVDDVKIKRILKSYKEESGNKEEI